MLVIGGGLGVEGIAGGQQIVECQGKASVQIPAGFGLQVLIGGKVEQGMRGQQVLEHLRQGRSPEAFGIAREQAKIGLGLPLHGHLRRDVAGGAFGGGGNVIAIKRKAPVSFQSRETCISSCRKAPKKSSGRRA